MTHDCPGHNFPCLTRKCYIPNIGWASYKDVAEGVRRYDVIFLGFQMLRQDCCSNSYYVRRVGGACGKINGRDTPTLCHPCVRTPFLEAKNGLRARAVCKKACGPKLFRNPLSPYLFFHQGTRRLCSRHNRQILGSDCH